MCAHQNNYNMTSDCVTFYFVTATCFSCDMTTLSNNSYRDVTYLSFLGPLVSYIPSWQSPVYESISYKLNYLFSPHLSYPTIGVGGGG